MTRKLLEAEDAALDAGQLDRLSEIWTLLRRAEKLGYSLTVSPEKAAELAHLLEECGLIKTKPPQ